MVTGNEIKEKQRKLKELETSIENLKTEIKTDLDNIDRQAFKGKTWLEFVTDIDETIQETDKITVIRKHASVVIKYKVTDDMEIHVQGTIFDWDVKITGYDLVYKTTGKKQGKLELPKKYSKEGKEIEAVYKKYKIERPSNKYRDEKEVKDIKQKLNAETGTYLKNLHKYE